MVTDAILRAMMLTAVCQHSSMNHAHQHNNHYYPVAAMSELR